MDAMIQQKRGGSPEIQVIHPVSDQKVRFLFLDDNPEPAGQLSGLKQVHDRPLQFPGGGGEHRLRQGAGGQIHPGQGGLEKVDPGEGIILS